MAVVTVFRSRLRPGIESAYKEVAEEMSQLVRLTEGFIDEKFYESPDGERVTIARFENLESEQAWASNPDHLVAQRRGRDEFYSWYDIVIAEELRSHKYVREESWTSSRGQAHRPSGGQGETYLVSTSHA